MLKTVKLRFAVLRRTAALRWERLRRLMFGAGDPQPSRYERQRLDSLNAIDSAAFDEFQKELATASDDEETDALHSEYTNRMQPVHLRIFKLETQAWIRAANELDVKVIALVDTSSGVEEPDEQSFGRLKRDVRRALRREHREGWQFMATVAGVLLGLSGFALSGCALYAQNVYQRDLLTATISSCTFDSTSLEMEGFLVNSGTRPVTVTGALPMIMVRAGVSQSVKADDTSTEFPLMIEPGKVEHFRVVIPFDARAVYSDDDRFQTRVGPDVKALRVLGSIHAWDASGGYWVKQIELQTQLFGPEGMRNGGGGFEIRPQVVVSKRRWLGAVGG